VADLARSKSTEVRDGAAAVKKLEADPRRDVVARRLAEKSSIQSAREMAGELPTVSPAREIIFLCGDATFPDALLQRAHRAFLLMP